MSGPHPPGREPDEPDPADEADDRDALDYPSDGLDELDQSDERDDVEIIEDPAQSEAHTRAYSAPESELFLSGPYLPADLGLYDYDDFDRDDDRSSPRWPWLVGVAAIVAAIALVTAVSLLATNADTSKFAKPDVSITTTSAPPVQDEITTTTPPPPSSSSVPPPPPPSPSEPPPPSETPTSSETPPPPPPAPSPSTTAPPPPAPSPTAAAPPPAPPRTTPAGPRQVTYSVTGSKAPGDVISVTYVDSSGRRRTQHNVYIPWSMTVTPISQSDVGSLEASSLFHVSKLNCSIITSDGTVLSSNTNDAPQTSC